MITSRCNATKFSPGNRVRFMETGRVDGADHVMGCLGLVGLVESGTGAVSHRVMGTVRVVGT